MSTEFLRLKPLPPGIPPEEVETRVRCNALPFAGGAVSAEPGENLRIRVTRRWSGGVEVEFFQLVAPAEPGDLRIAIEEAS